MKRVMTCALIAIFGAFVRMIDPKGRPSAMAPRAAEVARQYELRAVAQVRELEELRKAMRHLHQEAGSPTSISV